MGGRVVRHRRQATFAASIVLRGEETLLASGFPAIVLRLGGLYGPGRESLIDAVRGGRATLSPGPAPIHQPHPPRRRRGRDRPSARPAVGRRRARLPRRRSRAGGSQRGPALAGVATRRHARAKRRRARARARLARRHQQALLERPTARFGLPLPLSELPRGLRSRSSPLELALDLERRARCFASISRARVTACSASSLRPSRASERPRLAHASADRGSTSITAR